jgi:maltose alpha-D-glucosyltransferase/alpha-amylase
LACGTRTAEQLGAAFTFLLTWGSVPSIYYGDEIGLRYQPGLPTVEGSEIFPEFYNRAGCRTPMQWDDRANAGFSAAPAEALYLPIDPATDRPTVQAQLADPHSTLHLVRRLIRLRRAVPALGARASTTVLNAGYPFAFLRGSNHLVVLNPQRAPGVLNLDESVSGRALFAKGVTMVGNRVEAAGFGYGVFELTG